MFCNTPIPLGYIDCSIFVFTGHGTVCTGQSCTSVGNTDRSEHSQSDAKALFLDLQNPAQCSGTVTAWNYCFYRIESALNQTYIVDFVVYRRVGSGNIYRLVENSNTIVDLSGGQLAALNSDFNCTRTPLPESEMFEIQESDVLGACLNEVGSNHKVLDILAESVTNTLYAIVGCTESGVNIPSMIMSNQLAPSPSFALHLFVDVSEFI